MSSIVAPQFELPQFRESSQVSDDPIAFFKTGFRKQSTRV
jgi:hypothetical protein